MIKLRLPYPPSINATYLTGKGRFYKSRAAKQFQELVQWIIVEQKLSRFNEDQRLQLTCNLYPPDKRKRDIDNPCKVLLDSLQYSGLIPDDKQIKRLIVEMHRPARSKLLAYCEIELSVMGDDDKL